MRVESGELRVEILSGGAGQFLTVPPQAEHDLFTLHSPLFTLTYLLSLISVQRLHGGEQKTGALYPPASSHIFSIARKLGHNVLILFHNIPSSLPQLV